MLEEVAVQSYQTSPKQITSPHDTHSLSALPCTQPRLPALSACWLSQIAMLSGDIDHVRDDTVRWLNNPGRTRLRARDN